MYIKLNIFNYHVIEILCVEQYPACSRPKQLFVFNRKKFPIITQCKKSNQSTVLNIAQFVLFNNNSRQAFVKEFLQQLAVQLPKRLASLSIRSIDFKTPLYITTIWYRGV